MEQKSYDVFISYSRKDYVQNERIIPGNPISAIIELFDKNGISYWIDKDGIFVGEEFVKEISKAIVNSKMLVFVSSKNSNESEYTCGEILKAKKEKKQIIPFRIDKSDYNEKFEILLLPLHHVEYFEQPDAALSLLLREVNREKKRIEKIEMDEENQQIIETARNEIKEKAKEYNALVGQQDDILKDLYAKNKIIGNTKKRCPVCGKEVLVQSSFCDKCGWQFPSLYSLDGKKTPICDESQLALARAHWHDLSSVIQLQNENQKLEKEKQEISIKCLNLMEAHSREIEEEKYKTVDLKEQYEALDRWQKEIIEMMRELELEKVKSQIVLDSVQQDLIIPVNGLSIVMKFVEGGTFRMGARKTNPKSENYDKEANDNESPVHSVTLSPFYIGETVVTQALWKAVMGSEPTYNGGWEDQCGRGDNYPAYRVNYYDIVNEFIPELNRKTGNNFRLPTEAEWEYAARGGQNNNTRFKYSGSNAIDNVAWYGGNSNGKSHPVKERQPNGLGLYDMSGNVWEWCEDWYDKKYYSNSPKDNPQGHQSDLLRVLRGGCWYDNARDCRVSCRGSSDPADRADDIGFRLVLPQ